MSSHVMDEAERCDRLLLMREGAIIADDTPDGLRQRTGSADIESAFLASSRARRSLTMTPRILPPSPGACSTSSGATTARWPCSWCSRAR